MAYKLTKAERPGWWRCEDSEQGLSVEWPDKEFNGNNEWRLTEDARSYINAQSNADKLTAEIVEAMAKWIGNNHPETIF